MLFANFDANINAANPHTVINANTHHSVFLPEVYKLIQAIVPPALNSINKKLPITTGIFNACFCGSCKFCSFFIFIYILKVYTI